ncbi:Os02g0329600, partial [Oryza sativa Japonica Group]
SHTDTRRRGRSPWCRHEREAIRRCGRARRANTGTQVVPFLPPQASSCVATCTPKVFLHRSVLSISGISSTTNIDSGSDKYSCIVVRSTSARPGNAGSFTSPLLAVTRNTTNLSALELKKIASLDEVCFAQL